jgi:hypothetical protein
MPANKIVPVSAQSIVNVSSSADDQNVAISVRSQYEAERVQEILMLLTGLTVREKATIELIIDRLYDIGTVNAIDKKVRFRPLRAIAKFAARKSKPIARIVAWRWFRRNCPRLIARWLYTKVQF